jgi:hypothetical protein
MDPLRLHYALVLIREGHAKAVSVPDRFHILTERYAASQDGVAFVLTDKGKDKLTRKGR